jgi:hypothetical protein
MTSNLQDYSKVSLSSAFTKTYSTENFAHFIEEWVLNSAKDISLFVVALARESKARSNKKSTDMILRYLADNFYPLRETLKSEREKLRSSHPEFSQTEIGFLTFESSGYPLHETITIFDWLHDYSFDHFLTNGDHELLHLLFEVSQRDTFCNCDFLQGFEIDHFKVTERMLTKRLETPRSFDTPETYFQKWSRFLKLLNDPIIQQRWDRIGQD